MSRKAPGQAPARLLQNGEVPDGVCTALLDQHRPLAEAVERPEENELNEDGLVIFESDEDVFTTQEGHEEEDHESLRQFHRQQKLKRQRDQSHLAKQGVDEKIFAVRISIPVFEEDVFHASTGATAFVTTALRLTEEEATDMDEAKSRELTQWIQEGAISKAHEWSRPMSMRWVLA